MHWFRRYRKKTRGGLEIAPPPSGARVKVFSQYSGMLIARHDGSAALLQQRREV